MSIYREPPEAAEDLRASRRLACSAAFLSLASWARILRYSAFFSLSPNHAFFFRATRLLLRCRVMGVTRCWILGALLLAGLSPLAGTSRRTTYLVTSSAFSRLNILRMLLARLGPRRRGIERSVRPGISPSPFLTMTKLSTDRSEPTTQPRAERLWRSPVRRQR